MISERENVQESVPIAVTWNVIELEAVAVVVTEVEIELPEIEVEVGIEQTKIEQ